MVESMTIQEFLDVLSSKEPVPGGGGASALAGALGNALGQMVANLTIGKKKYALLWAGGAALLSYSLVYALRKPFTAAGFDGLDFFGMDYKTATSIVQISGYFISKLIGIKVISELKKENRLKFIILSVAVAELSLVLFGALPRPLNVFALFFNGLSLGCM